MTHMNTPHMNSTQDFPYTLKYVRDLLDVSQDGLDALMRDLGIVPERDPSTRQMVLTHREVSLVKRAMAMEAQFAQSERFTSVHHDTEYANAVSSLEPSLVNRLVDEPVDYPQVASVSRPVEKPAQNVNPSSAVTSTQLTQLLSSMGQVQGAMVDELSQHLSKLLDSKLSGLDSIVMELIRVKSENSVLKHELETLDYENYELKNELASFQELPMGFYRKDR